MDIVHPWTLDESGAPLLPITTFSIAMIHRWVLLGTSPLISQSPHVSLCVLATLKAGFEGGE